MQYANAQRDLIDHCRATGKHLNDRTVSPMRILEKSSTSAQKKHYATRSHQHQVKRPKVAQTSQSHYMTTQQKGTAATTQAPLLYVDVNLGPDKSERIVIYHGDTAEGLTEKFGEKHSKSCTFQPVELDNETKSRLMQMLQ